jgi:hypothetical protein
MVGRYEVPVRQGGQIFDDGEASKFANWILDGDCRMRVRRVASAQCVQDSVEHLVVLDGKW